MMALKCDNCGGYYNFDKDNDVTTMRLLNRDKTGNVYIVKGVHDKDLCPACMATITKALEDRKRHSVDPMEDDLK